MKIELKHILNQLKNRHSKSKVLFFAVGIISTIWFLIRVIPKPSRATYPCMRAAAPVMSGFVIYLISLGGISLALKKARIHFINSRFLAALAFILVAVFSLIFSLSNGTSGTFADTPTKFGPDDKPNQPIGKGIGIHPGRVVWVWDPKATNANCINAFELYKPENTNQGVVNRMFVDAIRKLGGKASLNQSWDAIFRSFNLKKKGLNQGYSEGEKIFIKINQGTANGKPMDKDRKGGYYISKKLLESDEAKNGLAGTCETYSSVVLELLRELVYVVGVDQKDIAIGDPISHIFGFNYDTWVAEFPDVRYVDKTTSSFGRTLIHPTRNELLFYSDKTQSDKLYDVVEDADYMINLANLKPHGRAGVSLTAKNHFGSHARNSAFHLHYSLISPVSLGNCTNAGYGKYRVMVDLMGSKYLGRNTLLYVVDGLYGGGSIETRVPVKYFMSPFNEDWCNSIFMSQDQVALESVCYDFLRTEWNGSFQHNPANNAYETVPNVNGVDDYLHQAADSATWPAGFTYDPDQSGKPLASLGTHEHWNNPVAKQYSRNLGKNDGIELISIPDSLVGNHSTERPAIVSGKKSKSEKSNLVTAKKTDQIVAENSEFRKLKKLTVSDKAFDVTNPPGGFYSAAVDADNTLWFLCDGGIFSFDGKLWTSHLNRKLPGQNLRKLVCDYSDFGKELWIASPQGATVASLPIDARSGATTYDPANSSILSENLLSVAIGKDTHRWFGTEKGISAFFDNKWLKASYQRKYPESQFKEYPITAMATSPDGDSLYVATEGAGVARLYRNEVDAISGASEYAQWGPIEIPSDKVYSICVTPDGTQWFGTDKGVARHQGYKTLENWTVFNTSGGLVNDWVQAIAEDKKGNMWFGTKAGISVFDGQSWISITEKDGLPGNNIRFITVDRNGIVWIGSEKGICSYFDSKLTRYR